jgi:hypothetical protein
MYSLSFPYLVTRTRSMRIDRARVAGSLHFSKAHDVTGVGASQVRETDLNTTSHPRTSTGTFNVHALHNWRLPGCLDDGAGEGSCLEVRWDI